MPKAATTSETTEKVARPFKPCECFSIFEYDLHADAEDDTSEVTGRAYGPCGAETQATFRQGHDAKLKSVLIACFRGGLEYGRLMGGMLVTGDPMAIAMERGWEHFLTPGKPKSAKAERKAKAKAATPEDKAALIAGMKLAAAKIKAETLVDPESGLKINVSTTNWQAILDGEIGKPESEVGLTVGSKVKVNYRAKTHDGEIIEIDDAADRAKVRFTSTGGKVMERVFELVSLGR